VLSALDRFDETIALLQGSLDQLECGPALVLAGAGFAAKDHALAGRAADHALAVASGPVEAARALAEQAKVLIHNGDDQRASALLHRALESDPHSVTAFKRLALQMLRLGDHAGVAALTGRLIAANVCHARVLAARTMALATLGRIDEARLVAGIARFLHRVPPADDAAVQSGRALADELLGSPALRQDRFGTASIKTARLDSPTAGVTPVWIALLDRIARLVEQWANSPSLCDHSSDHPWLAARPERALLRSWCVITGAEGHEGWHMHPDGWLSGGFYPQMPMGLSAGLDVGLGGGLGVNMDRAGHFALGLPPGLPGADAAQQFGEVTLLPQPGELILFPSHAYHHTYPHGLAQQRICVAFDVVPV
jgi:Putative 2OG-Fe(II) oxygenase